jgi:hypothetical protein
VSDSSATGDAPDHTAGGSARMPETDEPTDPCSTAMWLDLLGIGPEAERLGENLTAYRSILDEIRKLRTLDLTDIHPCVVFDPLLPYRGR